MRKLLQNLQQSFPGQGEEPPAGLWGAQALLHSKKATLSLAAQHVCTGKEHFQVKSGKGTGFPGTAGRQGSPQGSWLRDIIPQCPSPLQQPLCAPPELSEQPPELCPSVPLQSFQEVPHRSRISLLRPALHTAGFWKIQRDKQSQHPQKHPPTLFEPPQGGLSPFSPPPPGWDRRWRSFQRKEWLQCGGEPGTCPVLTAAPGRAPRQPGAFPCTGRNDPGCLPPVLQPPHSCGRAGAKFIPGASPPAWLDLDTLISLGQEGKFLVAQKVRGETLMREEKPCVSKEWPPKSHFGFSISTA